MQAIAEVLVTIETPSSTNSDEDDGSWAGADFFGLDDLWALCRFIGFCDYLLDGDDSNNGSYELAWP
jgi:hypothetical protein